MKNTANLSAGYQLDYFQYVVNKFLDNFRLIITNWNNTKFWKEFNVGKTFTEWLAIYKFNGIRIKDLKFPQIE